MNDFISSLKNMPFADLVAMQKFVEPLSQYNFYTREHGNQRDDRAKHYYHIHGLITKEINSRVPMPPK